MLNPHLTITKTNSISMCAFFLALSSTPTCFTQITAVLPFQPSLHFKVNKSYCTTTSRERASETVSACVSPRVDGHQWWVVLPVKHTAVSHGYIVSIAPCLDGPPLNPPTALLPPAALRSAEISWCC